MKIFEEHKLEPMVPPFSTYYKCANCGIEVFQNTKNIWVVGYWYRNTHHITSIYLEEIRCADMIIKEIIE